jgi:hypothetical protein
MKKLLIVLMGISEVVGISYYDKYLNRDVNSIILRNSEKPFYSSSILYSSHYAKLNLNISKYNNDIKK